MSDGAAPGKRYGSSSGSFDGDAAVGVAADDPVALEPDDALHEVLLRLVRGEPHEHERFAEPAGVGVGRRFGQPLFLVPKYDDVAALEGEGFGHELVDEDPVVDLKRVFH